jgi:DNA anti-recombination protein RmuC
MAKAKKTEATQIEKIQDSAKKLWLANLGAYARSFDEVKKRFEKLNDDSQKLFEDLTKEGTSVQKDVKKKYEEGTDKLETRLEELKDKLNVSPLASLENKLDEVSAKLEKTA